MSLLTSKQFHSTVSVMELGELLGPKKLSFKWTTIVGCYIYKICHWFAQNVESNTEMKVLDLDSLYVSHIQVNQAQKQRHRAHKEESILIYHTPTTSSWFYSRRMNQWGRSLSPTWQSAAKKQKRGLLDHCFFKKKKGRREIDRRWSRRRS